MTIRIKGFRFFTDMSANTDTPGAGVIPVAFHQLFVWKAFMDAAESGIADDTRMAARIERKYAAKLQQLANQDRPSIGQVHQLAMWYSGPRFRDALCRLKLPIS